MTLTGASICRNNNQMEPGPHIAKPYTIDASVTTFWKSYTQLLVPFIHVDNQLLILEETATVNISGWHSLKIVDHSKVTSLFV